MRHSPMQIATLALAVTLGLSGCAKIAQSKFNPLNWFKPGEVSAPAVLYVAPTDGRLLVAQVLSMKVDATPGGAIVRAVGLPPTQGWWRADLIKLDQEDETRLVFEFRLYPPVVPAPPGTPPSRQVTVATSLSNVQLENIQTIVVQGGTNTLSARR